MPVICRIEKSRSSTGKHACFANAYWVWKSGQVEEVDASQGTPTKPIYSRGSAKEVRLEDPPREGAVLVQVRLVKSLGGRVSGSLAVYSPRGELLLKCVYKSFKLRRSTGSRSYFWATQRVAEHLKLPLKKINPMTGGG
ncbi:MAG: hypothetical protein QXU97_06095 [Fervidicoccaceae archaeon]